MTFEYAAARIEVLELVGVADGHGGYAMCETHADRLSPPVGWELIDGRPGARTLFPVSTLEPPTPADAADSDVA